MDQLQDEENENFDLPSTFPSEIDPATGEEFTVIPSPLEASSGDAALVNKALRYDQQRLQVMNDVEKSAQSLHYKLSLEQTQILRNAQRTYSAEIAQLAAYLEDYKNKADRIAGLPPGSNKNDPAVKARLDFIYKGATPNRIQLPPSLPIRPTSVPSGQEFPLQPGLNPISYDGNFPGLNGSGNGDFLGNGNAANADGAGNQANTSLDGGSSALTGTTNGDQTGGGNINISGNVSATNSQTVNGNETGGGLLSITGDASFINNGTYNGDVTGAGALSIGGNLFLGGTVTVNGFVNPGGNLYVDGFVLNDMTVNVNPPPAQTTNGPTPLPPVTVTPDQGSNLDSTSDQNYAGGYGGTGALGTGALGTGGAFAPVVLDLTGNGIKITQLSSSSMFFDMTGDGQQNLTAWAGAGNGVLFYDPTGTGQLTQADQIDFMDWDPGATSDMQALEDVFDTNHDGSLDSGDTDFADFYVMVTNANGTQTAEFLASLGITSINLTANATNIALPDGSSIDGETTYTTSSGTTGTAATVTFAYDAEGNAVTTVTATNADGSTTIDNTALNADGSLAYQNILNTLITTSTSGGVNTTTTDKVLSDLNNGGVVETLQTDDTVATSGSSGNSSTETLANYEGGTISATGELTSAGTTGAELLNSTTTTTAAISGGTQVTILRDQTGGGWTSQEEVDTTYTSGATSEVVSDLNPNGSASDVETTATSVSSSGSTTTQTNEIDGNSAYATSSVKVISIGAASGSTPGTETETVTDSAGTTVTSLVTTTTVTTSNSVTATTTSDLTDGSTLDLTSVAATVTNSNGSTTITQTDTSANNTLLDETVTTKTPQSGGGLVTVVTSSELDGGTFTEVGSETTTISSAGATETTTVVDDSANGTELDESVTTSTVGSAAGTVTIYGNGDGEVTSTQTVTVSGGTTTGLEEDLNGNGSLIDATETVTSDGGLSKTTYTDATGAGTASAPTYDFETTDMTTTSAGVSTEIVTDYGVSTSDEIDQTKIVTSANGLTTTTYSDFTGANFVADGSWNQITTDQTTVNSDSSLTEVITTTDGYGNVLETTTKQTSANRQSVTTTTTLGTTNLVKTVETDVTQANGTVVDTVINEDYDGDVLGATVTTTSADGLVQTIQNDIQGQSAASYAASGLSFDTTTTDTTTIAANGSQTETENVTSENGTLLSTASVLTSANDLTITTTENPYATADYATQTVDSTTDNSDGSSTETVSDYAYNGALIDQTATTTSASGLSTTVLDDLNGAGATNQASTDVTTINANGSQTEVVTDYTGGTTGTVRDVTTTTSGIIVAGAGLETTVTRQSNGSVPTYQVETIVPSANGTVTDTTKYYAVSGGSLLMTTTDTTSANGLVTTDATSIGADTSNDFWTTDTTVLNANGSQTETAANYNQAGLISETVTTSYPNGLSTVTEEDANGAVNGSGVAIFNLMTTDDTVLNSNGSSTETVTDTNANATTIEQVVTITSADQQTITIDRYLDETGTISTADQTETVQTQANGAIIDTITSYGTSHQPLGTILRETSGNGLVASTTYENASGTAVDTQTDTTTYDTNGDGGTLEDFEDTDVVNGTNFTTSRKTQRIANNQELTISLILAGELASTNASGFSVTATEDSVIANTGITTETIADTIGSATSPNDTETIVTSADQLQVTTSVTLGSAASAFIVDQATTNLDGSTSEVTTYYNPASLSTIEDQISVNTSWDGRTIQTTTESDYDGTHYNDETETTVENANDTITETLSFSGSFDAPASQQTVNIVTNANASVTTTTLNYINTSTLNGQIVSEVSPDRLVKSFVEDTTQQDTTANLDAAAADLISGTALPSSMLATDMIGLDTTTLNTDGSTTEVVETAFGDSLTTNLRSKTTTTTSANGLSIVTDIDNDGNGVDEQVDTTTIAPDGSKQEVFNYYNDTTASTTPIQENTYNVSANGLVTTLTTSTGIADTTVDFADSNGSYEWSRTVTSGSAAATAGYAQGSATHDVDANGIDTWSWNDGSSGGTSGTITIAVATETQDIAIANEIYETLLGQPMDDSQTQYLAQYITNGVLNRQALATAIVNSSEYTSDYALPETVNNDQYTLLGGFDVIAAFENDLGRLPTAAESAIFDPYISNPTPANIATMAVAVAQYATDLDAGNNRTAIDVNQGLVSTNPIWLDYFTGGGGGGDGLEIIWAGDDLPDPLWSGDDDVIDAGDDSTITIDGNNDIVIGGSGDTINITGTSDDVNLGGGDTLTMSGGGDTASITGTGDGVTASDDTIVEGNGLSTTVIGNGNEITLGSGDTISVTGTGESLSGSGDTANFGAGSIGTITGTGDSVNLASGDAVTLSGGGDSAYIDGSGDVLTASGDTITEANSLSATIDGNSDNIALGSGDTVGVTGSGDYLSGSGDTVNFGAGTSGTVIGESDTINLASGSSLTIDDPTGGLSTVADIIYGSGNSITLTGGDYTWIDSVDSGNTIYVTQSNEIVWAWNGATVDIASDLTNVAVTGDYIYVNEGSYDTVDVYGGPWVDVSGNSSDDNEGYGSGFGNEPTGSDSSSGIASKIERKMNVVAQYDLSNGYTAAVKGVEAAWNKASQAIAASENPNVPAPSPFNNIRWTGSTITWSFVAAPTSGPSPVSGAIQSQYQAIIEQALQTWAAATGITFEQVSSSTPSDIQIGWGSFDTSDSGTIGFTTQGAGVDGQAQSVLIRLENPDEDSFISGANGALTYSGTDTQLYQAALHEIGHALGLAESSDPDSVMFPILGSDNRNLDATDIKDIHAIFNPTATQTASAVSPIQATDFGAASLNQLIQAMAAFTPQPPAWAQSQAPVHADGWNPQLSPPVQHH